MIMRKVFLALVLLFAGATTTLAYAADEIVTLNQLPQAAQQFLTKHYPNAKLSYAKFDNEIVYKSYDVVLENGTKIEFNSKGEWTQIDANKGEVPATVIPSQIKNYVTTNFKGTKITEIEKESFKKGYSVNLSSGLELKFDRNFKVVKIDD